MHDSLPYTEDDDVLESDYYSPYGSMNRKERRYQEKLDRKEEERQKKGKTKTLHD